MSKAACDSPSRARRATLIALALAVASLLASAGAASASKAGTVWLCKPGKKPDPCMSDRTATVVAYNGETRTESLQKPVKHGKPAVDCFYVYPTVSEQEGPNANFEIEPQQTQIAIDQASRFSQDCKVYAPVYEQLTLKAINDPEGISQEDALKAYGDVFAAFNEYLHKFNKGRGIVLIGHSQGALMLENLIKQVFDPNPALRKQLVSAVLLGGNVLVPEGQAVGGTFAHVPTCSAATSTGCVIAYSSFAKEPPANAFFGRPSSPLLGETVPPGLEVVCVNPGLLSQNGSVANLLPYAPTTPFPGTLGAGSPVPTASTPWVESIGSATGQCKHENGATWLNIALKEGMPQKVAEDLAAHNEVAEELAGPEWGLHLYDVNIALGNLVNTVAIQTQAYAFES